MHGTRKLLAACVGLLTLAACSTTRPGTTSSSHAPALRVAVPYGSPPYAFHQDGRLVGLEVDFAHALADALGRPLELFETDFTDLIGTARSGHADVLMGGLTITRARQVQIGFSDPYLHSGLIAMMRTEDVPRFRHARDVLHTSEPVGVVGGTTSERFVREQMPNAQVLPYPTIEAATNEIRTRHNTLVVADAPVAIWTASADEANLTVLLELLNDEDYGWGLSPGDPALQSEINTVLARWRTDGTRDRILARWVPYWQRLEARSAGR